MAIQDFLLVAVSTAVIVLCQLPREPARQVVEIRSRNGSLQTYSLDVGDPRLAKIRNQLQFGSGDTAQRFGADAALAMLKWQAEVAALYADSTDPTTAADLQPAGIVLPVSFTKPKSPANGQPTDQQAQHAYWLKVRDDAKAAIVAAEAGRKQQHSLTRPQMQLGRIVGGGHPLGMLLLAAAIGLCAAIGLATWTFACPAIRLDAEMPEGARAAARSKQGSQLRLAIPSDWVRVHQPAAVIARRTAYATIVIAALAVCLREHF